jgi:hypothetical protein
LAATPPPRDERRFGRLPDSEHHVVRLFVDCEGEAEMDYEGLKGYFASLRAAFDDLTISRAL